MAKIILGSRPKHFKKEVKFSMLDGTVGAILITYKYRTRSEYGAFIDAAVKASKVAADAAVKAAEAAVESAIAAGEKADGAVAAVAETLVPDYGMEKLLAKGAADNVQFVMDAVEGWNLDATFDRAAVEQLADEVPQAILTIIETYRLACTEGRLGN